MTLDGHDGGRGSRGPRLFAWGRALQDLRDRRGLSIYRLAERTRVDHSTVSKLEAGRRLPSYEMVVRLAEALAADEAERASLFLAAGFVPPDGSVLSLAGLDAGDRDLVIRLVASLREKGGTGGQPAPQIGGGYGGR